MFLFNYYIETFRIFPSFLFKFGIVKWFHRTSAKYHGYIDNWNDFQTISCSSNAKTKMQISYFQIFTSHIGFFVRKNREKSWKQKTEYIFRFCIRWRGYMKYFRRTYRWKLRWQPNQVKVGFLLANADSFSFIIMDCRVRFWTKKHLAFLH